MPLEPFRLVSLSCLGGWQPPQALLRGTCMGTAGCSSILLSSSASNFHLGGLMWFEDTCISAKLVLCQTGSAGVRAFGLESLSFLAWQVQLSQQALGAGQQAIATCSSSCQQGAFEAAALAVSSSWTWLLLSCPRTHVQLHWTARGMQWPQAW